MTEIDRFQVQIKRQSRSAHSGVFGPRMEEATGDFARPRRTLQIGVKARRRKVGRAVLIGTTRP
jgi:hypothetical protein